MLKQQTFLIVMNQKVQNMTFTLANDHLVVWPSSVTMIFNLPEQMFQMNNSAKSVLDPCINVEVMARTSSIYDHFIIWPSSVTLIFNLPTQLFQINNCARLFWNPCINVEVMAQTSLIYYHFIIWPSGGTLTFNLHEEMFQMALLIFKVNNCAKLFWNPCINVEVMAWTNLDGCTHNAPTHIHQTETVTTMSHSPQAGLTKINLRDWCCQQISLSVAGT